MPIGSTVAMSVPTVGTTLHTLNKASDGEFYRYETPVATYPSVPMLLSFRRASSSATQKNIGLTFKYAPNVLNDDLHPSLGRVSVTVNISSTPGTVVTDAVIESLSKEALSVLCQSAIFSALYEGSLQ